MGNSMGSPTTEYLTPQDRRQLEPVLDEFELALEECLSDKLHPDELRELFLQNHGGAARSYLEEEIQKICRERVRGNYIILQSIGHGGMGSVYKVKKIDFGSIHALKEIQSENFGRLDQEELIRRFAREIEIGRRLGNHPNIVQYTDAGECYNGVHFLVMEFIEGEDLETIVRRETKLPPADAAQIIHDHFGAVFRQHLGIGRSDPAACARDHRHAPIAKSRHHRSSVYVLLCWITFYTLQSPPVHLNSA